MTKKLYESNDYESNPLLPQSNKNTRPAPGGGAKVALGLDDPDLSQEDKDHRLAVELQRQEIETSYDMHKKKHDKYVAASVNRTTRSGTFTRLAAVRQKDHGRLSVPADYTAPNAHIEKKGYNLALTDDSKGLVGATPPQTADYQLARELQKIEQIGAGTAREMAKIIREESDERNAQAHRVERSNYHINRKGLRKKGLRKLLERSVCCGFLV